MSNIMHCIDQNLAHENARHYLEDHLGKFTPLALEFYDTYRTSNVDQTFNLSLSGEARIISQQVNYIQIKKILLNRAVVGSAHYLKSWLSSYYQKSKEIALGPVDTVSGFFNTVRHPVRTLQELGHVMRHPIESSTSIARNAYQHPLRFISGVASSYYGGGILSDKVASGLNSMMNTEKVSQVASTSQAASEAINPLAKTSTSRILEGKKMGLTASKFLKARGKSMPQMSSSAVLKGVEQMSSSASGLVTSSMRTTTASSTTIDIFSRGILTSLPEQNNSLLSSEVISVSQESGSSYSISTVKSPKISKQYTALISAIAKENWEKVDSLLTKNKNLTTTPQGQIPALIQAIFAKKMRKKIITGLLAAGANHREKYGNGTVLHTFMFIAVISNDHAMIRLLLENETIKEDFYSLKPKNYITPYELIGKIDETYAEQFSPSKGDSQSTKIKSRIENTPSNSSRFKSTRLPSFLVDELSIPRLKTLRSYTQRTFDTPTDHSCLFWAIALATLIPLSKESDHSRFNHMFELMFHGALITPEDPGSREGIRTFLSSYNPSAGINTQEQSILSYLITDVFRKNIVNYMSTLENFSEAEKNIYIESYDGVWAKYARRMSSPKTWGGYPEIINASRMLGINIEIANGVGNNIPGAEQTIQIDHVDESHYRFKLKEYQPIVFSNETFPPQKSHKRKSTSDEQSSDSSSITVSSSNASALSPLRYSPRKLAKLLSQSWTDSSLICSSSLSRGSETCGSTPSMLKNSR
jgi:hypothetical protein